MAKNGFRVFDCDLHVVEPWDLWIRYIEPKYRDCAPVGSREYAGDLGLIHDGKQISHLVRQSADSPPMIGDMASKYGRTTLFEDFERRGWGPDTQIEGMDAEGIDKAVLFPSRALYAHAKEYADDGLATAISRAYNNWLGEFCSYAPERLYGAGMLAAQDVQGAVHEVRRVKEELGFKGVFLRPNPVRKRNWHDPVYDPLWAECERQDLAVAFHEGIPSGNCAGFVDEPNYLPSAVAERFDGRQEDLWATAHTAAHPIEMMYVGLCVIFGGVCERFSTLRIALLEANCSWLPFWLWRMDEHYEHREADLRPKLPLTPTQYFKRQCFAAMEADERPAKSTFEWLGDDNIVFSTDYPHEDSMFPTAVDTLMKLDVAEDTIRKVLWDNCARLYNMT